jgi:hypothetical protein
MKKSRFSEQQIAFVLRQAEQGTADSCRRGVPQGGDQRGIVLQLAQKVWRADAVRDEAAEAQLE